MPKQNKLAQLNAQHRCLLELMQTGAFEWKDLADQIRAQDAAPENWLTVRHMIQKQLDAGTLRREPDVHRERYVTICLIKDPVAKATTEVLAPARQALLEVIAQAGGVAFSRNEADSYWEVRANADGSVCLGGYAADAYGCADLTVGDLALSDLAYLAEAAAKAIAKQRV